MVIRMIEVGYLQVESRNKAEYINEIAEDTVPLAGILINLPLKKRFCIAVEEIF